MSLQVAVHVTITAIDGTPYASSSHGVIVPYITPNFPEPSSREEYDAMDEQARRLGAQEMSLAATKAWSLMDEAKTAIHEQLNVLTNGLLDRPE